MATIDLKIGGTSAPLPFNVRNADGHIVRRVDTTKTTITSSDTVEIISIPAYCQVIAAFVKVITAEGSAMTVDIGDADSASYYFNDLSVNSTAGTMTASSANAKLYSATGTVKVVTSGDPSKAVFDVILVVRDLNQAGA